MAGSFTKADVTRAVQGAISAGATVTRFQIEKKTGNIIVFLANDKTAPIDDLDKELAEFEARHGKG